MTTRLLVLLVLLTALPAMGMLWLMNRAAAIETTAGQQQVLEAYRGQLRLVRSRLDPLWRAHAAHLEEGDATPEDRFTRLVTQEQADAMKAEVGGRGWGPLGRGANDDAQLAAALGITEAELTAAREEVQDRVIAEAVL